MGSGVVRAPAPSRMSDLPAKSLSDLVVWQKAHGFVLRVYSLSATFPHDERFGLTAQIRRAAASIPANIAEGFRRRSRPEKARFMNIAEASLQEARYYLILGECQEFRV
jgi:four helix bundle protein